MSTELETRAAEMPQSKTKKQRSPGLLIALIVFIILFLFTSVVLGSRLYRLATLDKYTVDMGMGEPDGEIELFHIEYSNEEGAITVQGANGENVVAPGTTVTYDIRLRNNDEMIINFLMVPKVEFLSDHQVPVRFKLIDNYGNYLLGSETEWVHGDNVNLVAHKGSIHPGEVYTYHLIWQWEFEVSPEQDVYDTFLGNMTGEVLPGVRVSITTESIGTAAPAQNNKHMMHLLGQGFGCCWCCWLVWVFVLVGLLLLIWVWRLRKKLRQLTAENERALQNSAVTGP